jgi:hypothetical protein
MVPIALVVGLAATMLSWRFIVRGRDVWRTLPPVLGVLGLIAILLGRGIAKPVPAGSHVPGPVGQLLVGAATGLLLFVATRIFVVLAAHVPAFARQTAAAYAEAATADRRRELILSLLLAVPGEELFWRFLAYRWGASQLSSTLAAAGLVWLGYVIANVPSRSLPIIAGAIVGGALWGGLAWWSAGVLAPLASHILWTGSMLVFPPHPAPVPSEGSP